MKLFSLTFYVSLIILVLNFETKYIDGKSERPLRVGDTLTPYDLLPVTTKLISKVEAPGEGKGVVSSAKSPQKLADKLFQGFFLTEKRTVTLQDGDISGLDALQALALSGEKADSKFVSVHETGERRSVVEFRGQYVDLKPTPRRSHYNLIRKRDDDEVSEKPKENERRVIDLAKRLNKKRRLVVNRRRRKLHGAENERNKVGRNKMKKINASALNRPKESNKQVHDGTRKDASENSTQPACRWTYECEDLNDLDTCRLHTECSGKNHTSKEFINVKHRSEENTKILQQFRKMLKISLVDEEVEKILEHRVFQLSPSNFNNPDRMEDFTQYYNRVKMIKEMGTVPSGWTVKVSRRTKSVK